MLRASIIFFILGIVSMFLGMNSIAGLSIDIGKILLFVFLALSIVSFIVGRKKGKSMVIILLAFSATTIGNYSLQADDSVTETAKEVANDTKRAAKSSVRKAKDTTCTLVNGKTECAAKRVKHTIQNGADGVEDAID